MRTRAVHIEQQTDLENCGSAVDTTPAVQWTQRMQCSGHNVCSTLQWWIQSLEWIAVDITHATHCSGGRNTCSAMQWRKHRVQCKREGEGEDRRSIFPVSGAWLRVSKHSRHFHWAATHDRLYTRRNQWCIRLLFTNNWWYSLLGSGSGYIYTFSSYLYS